MTDIERGRIGGIAGDEDRLPWLEPVESDEPEPAVGAGKLIAAVLVALLAIGLVIGGLFWLRERSAGDTGTGNDNLIAAPAGNYKVAPSDPGGMDVEGEGDATYAASQGVPVDAAIDISKRPETPVATPARAPEPVKTVPLPASTAVDTAVPARPAPPAVPAAPRPAVTAAAPKPALPAPRPATPAVAAALPAPAKPAPAKPAQARPTEVAKKPEPAKSAAASGGPAVQLGAFGSEAKAQAAWTGLTGRFPALRAFSHSVTLAEVGGKKLYRLRAAAGSSAKASAVCRALASAKEACAVIG